MFQIKMVICLLWNIPFQRWSQNSLQISCKNVADCWKVFLFISVYFPFSIIICINYICLQYFRYFAILMLVVSFYLDVFFIIFRLVSTYKNWHLINLGKSLEIWMNKLIDEMRLILCFLNLPLKWKSIKWIKWQLQKKSLISPYN